MTKHTYHRIKKHNIVFNPAWYDITDDYIIIHYLIRGTPLKQSRIVTSIKMSELGSYSLKQKLQVLLPILRNARKEMELLK